MSKPVLDQINIVSGNPDESIAFYRRLGVEIPDDRVWRTATGIHHVSAAEGSADRSRLRGVKEDALDLEARLECQLGAWLSMVGSLRDDDYGGRLTTTTMAGWGSLRLS